MIGTKYLVIVACVLAIVAALQQAVDGYQSVQVMPFP
jgi:hypothetical protein